jgi:hypothetical protein
MLNAGFAQKQFRRLSVVPHNPQKSAAKEAMSLLDHVVA